MKIVYLVHGYPPREKAGTEQHCALLANGMQKRGHQVLVIAATRSVGQRHTELIREKGILRIVNNIPSRPLKEKEKDAAIHNIIRDEIENVRPDIIHIEHIQFLSSSLIFDIPTLLTLHDAWFWCPAGGTLLRDGQTYCQHPTAQDCLRCSARWRPKPTTAAFFLTALAGQLHPLIPASQLHRLWQKLPSQLRRRISQQKNADKLERPIDLSARNQELLRLAEHCRAITAPSQFLARLAMEQGMKGVQHIRNGVEERREHIGGAGFVFLGTMEHHKGPVLVEEAYYLAFPNQNVPIHFYGAGSISVRLPHSPPISRAQVFDVLQKADCLVLGSIWPENAPMIILEARACGCPTIAPNIGGIPEIIADGLDGFLYQPGDRSDLAKKMRLSRTFSFSPRPPPGQEQVLDQYEQAYQDIL